MTTKLELLKINPYFRGLPPEVLEAIAHLITEKKMGKEEMVFAEGEDNSCVYFLVSGAVKVFKTSVGGKEQILRIVRPVDAVNDILSVEGGLSPFSALTLQPSLFHVISKRDMESLSGRYAEISRNALRILGDRIVYLIELIEDLSFRSVTGRVAKLLLQFADESPVRVGGDGGRRLTQQEMAAMAGTVREMVSRSLKVLESEGAINFDRHRIVIRDKDVLREIAAG